MSFAGLLTGCGKKVKIVRDFGGKLCGTKTRLCGILCSTHDLTTVYMYMYNYKIILNFFILAMQCIRHHIHQLASGNLLSFIKDTRPLHMKIFTQNIIMFLVSLHVCYRCTLRENVVDFQVTVKGLEQYTVECTYLFE